jgi:hypothetical protein
MLPENAANGLSPIMVTPVVMTLTASVTTCNAFMTTC